MIRATATGSSDSVEKAITRSLLATLIGARPSVRSTGTTKTSPLAPSTLHQATLRRTARVRSRASVATTRVVRGVNVMRVCILSNDRLIHPAHMPGEYIFNHASTTRVQNSSFAEWFLNEWMISNETLLHPGISGMLLDDHML